MLLLEKNDFIIFVLFSYSLFWFRVQLATTHAKDERNEDLHAACILMSKTSNCGTRSNGYIETKNRCMHSNVREKLARHSGWSVQMWQRLHDDRFFISELDASIGLRAVSRCATTHSQTQSLMSAVFMSVSLLFLRGRGGGGKEEAE